jgi:hypothetical protein
MPVDGLTHHGAAMSTAVSRAVGGEPCTGHVLGSSRAGLYLAFTDEPDAPSVVALLPASSIRLPIAVVSADPLPDGSLDDAVVGGGVLRVGAHAWHPLRWFDPRPRNLQAVRPRMLADVARLLHRLNESDVGLDRRRAWAAAEALALGDCEPAFELLGAGPGLTPAGDDVVAGALAACALSGGELSPDVVGRLLSRAREATTTLSAALLSCAAAGQVVPQAAGFLRALSGGGGVQPALGRLRAVGSTSGTALAVGLTAALCARPLDRLDRLGRPGRLELVRSGRPT